MPSRRRPYFQQHRALRYPRAIRVRPGFRFLGGRGDKADLAPLRVLLMGRPLGGARDSKPSRSAVSLARVPAERSRERGGQGRDKGTLGGARRAC